MTGQGAETGRKRDIALSLSHLCVLVGYLKEQGQVSVVEGVVQGEKSSMHSALSQVICEFLQTDGLHPAHHALVRPNHHIWASKKTFLA